MEGWVIMIQDVSCATLSLIISLLNWMSCALELWDLSARDFETLRSAKKIMQKPDFEIWPKFSKPTFFEVTTILYPFIWVLNYLH